MTLEVTFKQVCDFVKKDGRKDPKLIEAVDNLLGLALICSPVWVGPAAVAALPTLAVKNELVKIGKSVFSKLVKKDADYIARQQRMQIAYGLLCFTSFFEALDRQIPKRLRDRIGLLREDKQFLAKSAIETVSREKKLSSKDCPVDISNPVSSLALSFPHPTESLSQQLERHEALWKQMGQGFLDFLEKLTFWEDAQEDERNQVRAAILKIPEEATTCFEAQYWELASTFEEFAIWANLQEHKKGQALLGQVSDYVRQYAALANGGATSIDIGFAKLHETVLNIPESLKTKQAADLVESLTLHYNARLNEPIIDKEEPQEGKPRLSFPLVCDAFIPQAYRFLRHTAKARSLEDETTWEDLPRRSDLGAFMLGFLSSPYSTESPLLVLGHPGSGKSLLTTVLSAQLMSRHYTAIRVPLREVNAEAGIVAQIEETVRRITHISVDSWAKLSSAFKNNPPLVILDGYDELLQASGKVFSGYLKEVQNFQKSEAEQGRPVRVIVTSRVTLIDKATIPSGATILRLLEFDKNQRDRWISIWNRTNVGYFRDASIEEFVLPDDKEEGAQKVLALAEQPLLLLMLALYDSEKNELRKSKALDRTKLYDSLLRRFIARERGKEKSFDETTAPEKKKILDVEMHRLGVAALAMYNRRKVHILSTELNEDLKFFDAERSVTVISGKPLSQADLLLGSFFFVHKSKAQHKAGASEHHEEASAFEFLHNTFGEFLTADFILRRALAEVEALKALKESEVLRAQLEQRLGAADGFQREWFASLVYTALFTRPVVLQMMREWVGHILKERNLPKEMFVSYLDTVVLNQIKRLLNKREMPSIIRKETAQEGYRAPFGDYPLLGHIAIYSINLILLRVIVTKEPFIFNESEIDTHEDGARPWDRLTHMWRSWFALDNLNGVTAIWLANRKESEITLQAKERFQVAESRDRLETCFNVALSLGDNIASGLAGFILFDPSTQHPVELDDIGRKLDSEKIDVQLQLAMKRLESSRHLREERDAGYFWQSARQALEMAFHTEKFEELGPISSSIGDGVRRIWAGRGWLNTSSTNIIHTFREIVDPRLVCEIGPRNPAAALLLVQIAKELGDERWQLEFRHRFSEFAFRRHHRSSVFEQKPESSVAWIRLLREAGGAEFLRRAEPDVFERVFHPRYLLELSEQNPEAALAWVQLAREMGAEEFLRRTEPEFSDSLFHPGHLQEISKRNPELALEWLQLVREAGHGRFLRRLEPRVFESLFRSGYLVELSKRNPQAALTWVQLAREVGGGGLLERFRAEFFKRIFHQRELLDLSDWNPEGALALVEVAREIDNQEFLRRIEPSFFERMFHPRYLLSLSERSPQVAVAFVKLAREVGGKGLLRRFEPEFFEETLHPRVFLELSERNPEAALAWLGMALELGGESFLGRLEPDFFQRAFSPPVLDRLLRRRPQVFAVALRLARTFELRGAKDMIMSCLTSFLENRESGVAFFGDMPLWATDDLKWLAKESASPGLNAALVSLVGNSRPLERS